MDSLEARLLEAETVVGVAPHDDDSERVPLRETLKDLQQRLAQVEASNEGFKDFYAKYVLFTTRLMLPRILNLSRLLIEQIQRAGRISAE